MPDRTWMERIRGKRLRDIDLPNESGQYDPNLPPRSAQELMEDFKRANKAAANDPLAGLKSVRP